MVIWHILSYNAVLLKWKIYCRKSKTPTDEELSNQWTTRFLVYKKLRVAPSTHVINYILAIKHPNWDLLSLSRFNFSQMLLYWHIIGLMLKFPRSVSIAHNYINIYRALNVDYLSENVVRLWIHSCSKSCHW